MEVTHIHTYLLYLFPHHAFYSFLWYIYNDVSSLMFACSYLFPSIVCTTKVSKLMLKNYPNKKMLASCECVCFVLCFCCCCCCWYICSLKHNKMGWFVQQQNLHNMINVLENRGCLRILHMQIKEASMKQQETFSSVFSAVTIRAHTRNKKGVFFKNEEGAKK